jgi:hypothetical protein
MSHKVQKKYIDESFGKKVCIMDDMNIDESSRNNICVVHVSFKLSCGLC